MHVFVFSLFGILMGLEITPLLQQNEEKENLQICFDA